LITGLIDIHNHTIPGLDDGARDMELAVDMLKYAESEGVAEIILTPHYHGGFMENSYEATYEMYRQLVTQASNNNINVNLHLGNEIYYYPSITEWVREGRVSTLAGSDYILAEFSNRVSLRELKDAVSNITSNGYIPILAHVERYEALVDKKKELAELIKKGALIQINSESISGECGMKVKRFAKWALANEYVHFVGSDAHSMGHRKPKLQQAAQYIASHYSEEYMRRIMIDNPRCVIENLYIEED